MILSRLLALLIAFSLVFGPLAMERAMAAEPATGHSQMISASKAVESHCQPGQKDKTQKGQPERCCAAMCATAAILPEAIVGEHGFDRLTAIPTPVPVHRGVLREIVPPPPRTA